MGYRRWASVRYTTPRTASHCQNVISLAPRRFAPIWPTRLPHARHTPPKWFDSYQGVDWCDSFNRRSLSGDGSHTGEAVLCLGFDMNTCQTSIKTCILLMYLGNLHPGYQIHENTASGSQQLNERGKEKRTNRPTKYVSYNTTMEIIIASYWSECPTNLSAFRN